MVKFPQKHIEIPQVLMAVFAMDTIGCLPVMSRGHQWALTVICMFISYVFVIPMKETSAENVVQAYLSGILTNKGGSTTILSDNGTELKKYSSH